VLLGLQKGAKATHASTGLVVAACCVLCRKGGVVDRASPQGMQGLARCFKTPCLHALNEAQREALMQQPQESLPWSP
jgi:hypothetical protein